MVPALAFSQDVIVSRSFTALWTAVDQENQGINLQIVEQLDGSIEGVAYWFTYGEDMASAWFIGIGPVSGNLIKMDLYEVDGVGFLEANDPNRDEVEAIGQLEMEFWSCDDGEVRFSSNKEEVGSGMFDVERLTNMINTECSGGISDNTPADAPVTEQRIALEPAREGITGSGHADYEERPDRTEFSVEVEDIVDGSYRIVVGGVDQGGLTVNLGTGKTEFRSPVEAGKILLTFDPRGKVIEVQDDQGAVLTTGDMLFDSGDDNGGESNIDFGSTEIMAELSNTGIFPLASGDAKLQPQTDRTDFSVEIEDVPIGDYDVRIGGDVVGTIQVMMLQDGAIQGELEFRDPVEPGKLPLDFDPRGQQIDVLDGTVVILETLFPSG